MEMLPEAPRCYYDFRSSVAELTLGAVPWQLRHLSGP